MRRGPKPAKSKEAKPPVAQSPTIDKARISDLEKRLTEALEQQTATANILRVISRAPAGLGLVLDAVLKIGIRLCEAQFANVFLYNGETFELALAHGAPLAWERRLRQGGPLRFRPPFFRPEGPWRVLHVPDLKTAAPYREREPIWVQAVEEGGVRTFLAVPLVKEDRFLGTLMIYRQDVQLFTDKQIGLLETFADQAVIAIENVRLFTELQEKNEALTQAHAQVSESLEQQTATSEILRVISSSPTDLQPVFDAIIASAVKLCEAYSGILVRVEDGFIHRVAGIGPHRESPESVRRSFPRPLDPTTALGQAILERRVNQLPDTESSTAAPVVRDAARAVGFRAELSVPMIRDGEPIGGIAVTRRNPGPFSPAEVQLLQTFADQAVIAIENVRLFKELEAANRELAAASQHKSEFLANMSHELRTPLNAIIGFSEVLSEKMFGELNEKQEEYSKDIHASGQHLLSLINDILDLSKIEAGRMELELTDFHLPTALDSALTLVRERAGRRSIALHTNIDNRLGQIQADERKVRQVVLNLLSNAIKFTPEGGRIEVGAVPKDGFVEVSVSDTGVGIAPEDQEKVFEEFRQVGTPDKKVEGTGLGLTLCRKFVELHGGRIWVKSELGAGSIFKFTIPMHREDSRGRNASV